MRPVWHRSLAGRLFLLISLCLVSTVVGISLQNGALFYKTLDRQVEDGSVAKAKEIAAATNNILEGWTGQVAVAIYALAGKDRAGLTTGLQQLLNASQDLVSVQVFDADRVERGPIAFALKHDVKDVRFEGSKPEDWRAHVKKTGAAVVLRHAKTKVPKASLVEFSARDSEFPLVEMVIRFRSDTAGINWLVLVSCWQTRILAALPNTQTVIGEIVRGDGTPVLGVKRGVAEPLVAGLQEILDADDSTFGLKSYVDDAGIPRIGALAKLADRDLAAVVLADARPSRLAVKGILLQTAAWAWVFLLGALMLSYLSVAGVTRKLSELTTATLRIAGGDFSSRYTSGGKDEVGALGASVNHMAGRIESLLKSQVDAARREKELETARMVQNTLFPKDVGTAGALVVSGHCHPASECGGDWWWNAVGADGLHYVVIADAVGHGVGAAIVTALAFSSTQTIMSTLTSSRAGPENLRTILQAVNAVLWSAGGEKMLMTAQAMAIDPVTLAAHFCAAGHQFPYIIRPGETGKKAARRLRSRGSSPLGLEPQLNLSEVTIQLSPGDKVFLYTDGLIECKNAAGEAWGRKRAEASLRKLATSESAALAEKVLDGAFQFFAGHPVDDDITVVSVEVRADDSASDELSTRVG